jgi:dihydroorotate dehydrogenase (fumarate)
MDVTTTYLGLKLKNPLVASASPLSEDLGNIRKMEDAGAAAVVLHSLFEEQINLESHELDRYLGAGTESFPESLTYLPELNWYNRGPDGYLEYLHRAKRAVQIPIIASLNGSSPGGWTKYARRMEQAGADALELNIYYLPTNPDVSSGDVERTYCDLVREVKSTVGLPVAVKLSPYFSAMANMGRRLDQAGANALVLFNRFYQPDFDLENLEVVPNLVLSSSHELLLRLHWVAILYGNIRADLAVTGGVHTAEDVLKTVMAGAHVAMMTSALIKNGIEHFGTVLTTLAQWMDEHEYESIVQMRGSMAMRSVA